MPIKIFIFLFFSLFIASSGFAQKVQLKIEGKNARETQIIDSIGYISSHPSFSELKKEIDSSFFKIQKTGFLDAEVKNLKHENDSLYSAIIYLNEQFPNLRVYYSLNSEEKKALAAILTEVNDLYFTIPINKTEETLDKLVFLKTKNGDPFTSLQLTEIKKSNGTVSAKIKVSTSKTRKIDKVIVEGYEKFPSSYRKHYLQLKRGQTFDKEKITRRANRVKNLPFVSEIKPPEILFTKDSTTVYLYLKKDNSNIFDGFLGFSNSENEKLVFNGNVNLQLWNNLNFGEKLNIQYKSDGNDQLNFNAGLELPYLFKTPVGIIADLHIFKQDSTFINVSQKINATYGISGSTGIYAGYRSTTSTNLTDNISTITNVVNYEASFFNFGATYLKRDFSSPLFPTKTAINFDADIGNRESTTKVNQQILKLNLIHNFFITNRSSFYVNSINNYLFSEEYISNELFRFGGINSLRGYLENSIYANYFSTIQTEFRYILSPNLYAHTILDAAYFENELQNQQRSLIGFGFGLGLQTQSGLLRVNLANGSFENETFSFSNSKIHLSLTVQF